MLQYLSYAIAKPHACMMGEYPVQAAYMWLTQKETAHYNLTASND